VLYIFRKKKKDPVLKTKKNPVIMRTVDSNDGINDLTRSHLDHYEENVKSLKETDAFPDQAHNVITDSKSKRQKRKTRKILKKR
jgi:hypothetical protein